MVATPALWSSRGSFFDSEFLTGVPLLRPAQPRRLILTARGNAGGALAYIFRIHHGDFKRSVFSRLISCLICTHCISTSDSSTLCCFFVPACKQGQGWTKGKLKHCIPRSEASKPCNQTWGCIWKQLYPITAYYRRFWTSKNSLVGHKQNTKISS